MTIHKSKGLQFKAVFLLGMNDMMEKPGKGLTIHPKYGLTLPYCTTGYRIRKDTVLNEALDVARRFNERAERARVLYVAMTRAEEKLIIPGGCAEGSMRRWRMKVSDYTVDSAVSMLDWIMNTVINDLRDSGIDPDGQECAADAEHPFHLQWVGTPEARDEERRSSNENALLWAR